jgi:hypothetical protein
LQINNELLTGGLLSLWRNLTVPFCPMLRELYRPDYTAIASAPIPQNGLGLALNERLKRAAA